MSDSSDRLARSDVGESFEFDAPSRLRREGRRGGRARPLPERLYRLITKMLPLLLIGVPALEVFVFIEVGLAIGWLPTVLLLFGTSVLGGWLVRIQGRAAIQRVSLAVSERRAPGRAAIDGALGFLGGLLLVVPGFLTDALGALLLLAPTRALARRWLSRHYAGRAMSFVATTGRFAAGARSVRPADVESTVVEEDRDELGP
jgi:UPF0716 protein FxsA